MTSADSSSTTRYRSTRGGATDVSFEAVVLGGLANDRGLYVPETLPTVTPAELEEVRTMVNQCNAVQWWHNSTVRVASSCAAHTWNNWCCGSGYVPIAC